MYVVIPKGFYYFLKITFGNTQGSLHAKFINNPILGRNSLTKLLSIIVEHSYSPQFYPEM